jgi:hypothetical protein
MPDQPDTNRRHHDTTAKTSRHEPPGPGHSWFTSTARSTNAVDGKELPLHLIQLILTHVRAEQCKQQSIDDSKKHKNENNTQAIC